MARSPQRSSASATATKPRRRPQLAPRPRAPAIGPVPRPVTVTNLHDSGTGSLRAAVQYANAHANTTIKFAVGLHGAIKLTSGELAITRSTAIDGPGAQQLTVSGTGRSRVFDIKSDTAVVTISGLTITGGLADDNPLIIMHGLGGGILNQGTLALKGVVVSSNQAVGACGDTISPCGYSLTGAGGGGVANLGTLTVSDSTFEGNQARGASGSSDSPAQGNTAPGTAFGGGLANVGNATATVTNCQFTGNLARGGDDCTATDACTLTPPTKTNTDVAGDAAGGAIASFGFSDPNLPPSAPNSSVATLKVSGSKFSKNRAIGGNGNVSPVLPGHSFGGAIASHRFNGSADLTVKNCTFAGNQSVGGDHNVVTQGKPDETRGFPNLAAAGGVFACGKGMISDSYFDGNRAIGGEGVAGKSGLEITKNGGDARGGGLSVAFPKTDVTVSNCTIKDSLAVGGQAATGGSGGNAWGGGVGNTAKGPKLTVTGGTIFSNQARGGSGDASGPPSKGGDALGGGVYNVSGSTTDLTACKITANGATGGQGKHGGSDGQGCGGGLYNVGEVILDPATVISNNQASPCNNSYGYP